MPLNVLPTMTNSPSLPRAPRCRFDNQPVRRPWPHSTAITTRSSVCTGFTLRHAPPRRPASYVAARSFTITPSWPLATAASRKRCASSGSAVTIDGSRRDARHGRRQQLAAYGQRLVDDGVAADVEDVEEERCEPGAAAGRRRRRSRPSCPGSAAACHRRARRAPHRRAPGHRRAASEPGRRRRRGGRSRR